MDFLIDFLTQYGYWGMLIAAFIAGSFFPFSSEAVMLGLLATGLDGWLLIVYGSIGNILGSMVNYGFGRLGRLEWVERYLHVKPRDLQRAQRFMAGRVPPHHRLCHHYSSGLYARQHPRHSPEYRSRKVPALLVAHLRSKLPHRMIISFGIS